MMNKLKLLVAAVLLLQSISVQAQIPHPRETFGHEVGADYKLADYDQMLEYYDKLAASTDRVEMIEIGKSVMERPIKLVFISSEENIAQLEKWREISEKLSRAEITEEEARALSKEGKAIVWFDGGMHATERAHAQMTSELLWRVAAEEDGLDRPAVQGQPPDPGYHPPPSPGCCSWPASAGRTAGQSAQEQG